MVDKCNWCKQNEGTSFWVTGAWLCVSCKNEAVEKHNKVIEETEKELKLNSLEKFW